MDSPYRTRASASDSAVDDPDRDACPDVDVLPLLVVFWLASVARVVTGIARHEPMGAEATLAGLTVLFLPVVFKGPVAWWWNRLRQQR
jgi:hypothetical protein